MIKDIYVTYMLRWVTKSCSQILLGQQFGARPPGRIFNLKIWESLIILILASNGLSRYNYLIIKKNSGRKCVLKSVIQISQSSGANNMFVLGIPYSMDHVTWVGGSKRKKKSWFITSPPFPLLSLSSYFNATFTSIFLNFVVTWPGPFITHRNSGTGAVQLQSRLTTAARTPARCMPLCLPIGRPVWIERRLAGDSPGRGDVT